MIDRPIPVQKTQQEKHSNAKHYHKKTLKTHRNMNHDCMAYVYCNYNTLLNTEFMIQIPV